MDKIIGFIGSGNMATAMIGGILNAKIVLPNNVMCSDPSKEKLEILSKTYGVKTTINNCEVAKKADILVLSVKPQFYPTVIEEIKNQGLYDIKLENKTYPWNMTNKEWILRKESINEIGCIHTTQGYDLNYVGVILGKEIDYDPINNQILIYSDTFSDTNVKKGRSKYWS